MNNSMDEADRVNVGGHSFALDFSLEDTGTLPRVFTNRLTL
jgi:hypothetical protein